jgi:hypothetical protein
MRTARYATKKVIIFGVVHIVLGLFAIALGISSASPMENSFPYGNLGYGIWCGIFYIINGCVGIVSGIKKSPSPILWHLILSIISAVLACLHLSLAIASTSQDYMILRLRYWYTTTSPTDVAYFNDLWNFCVTYFPMTASLAITPGATTAFGYPTNAMTQWLHYGTIAVDALLACGGFLSLIFSLLSAAAGCKVTCCPNCDIDEDMENMHVTQVVTQVHPHPGHHKQVEAMAVPNVAYTSEQ